MQTNELTGVLKDLIRINNDRIEGYEKAISYSKDIDADLHGTFSKMIDESRKLKEVLVSALRDEGDSMDDIESTTNSGKIYRVWMDVRSAFSGKDKKSVLDLCEFGEDAAQNAYQQALELKKSHDLIKSYRDMHAKAKEIMSS